MRLPEQFFRKCHRRTLASDNQVGWGKRRYYDRRQDAAECERPTRAGKARAGGSANTAEPSECGGSAGSARGAGTEPALPQLKKRAAEVKPIYQPQLNSRTRIRVVSECTAPNRPTVGQHRPVAFMAQIGMRLLLQSMTFWKSCGNDLEIKLAH